MSQFIQEVLTEHLLWSHSGLHTGNTSMSKTDPSLVYLTFKCKKTDNQQQQMHTIWNLTGGEKSIWGQISVQGVMNKMNR